MNEIDKKIKANFNLLSDKDFWVRATSNSTKSSNRVMVGHLSHLKSGKVPVGFKPIYIGRKNVWNKDMTNIDEFRGMFGNMKYSFEQYEPSIEHINILKEELKESNLFLACFCFKTPVEWDSSKSPHTCHGTKIADKLLKG